MKTTVENPLVRERSTVQSCPAAPFSSENPTSDRKTSEIPGSTNRELGGSDDGKSLDRIRADLTTWLSRQTDDAIISTTLILIRSLNPKRPASLSQIAENAVRWEAAVRAGR